MVFDEACKCRDIVAVKHRHGGVSDRTGRGNGDDGGIIAGKPGMIKRQIAHFDLVVGIALVALDDNEVAWAELGEDIL